MFGITPTKILFTILLIVAAWYGFKLIERRISGTGTAAAKPPAADPVAKKDTSAEDMKKCSVCSAYVSAAAPTNCGRADCPYSS